LSTADNTPCLASQRNAVVLYMTTRLHYKLKFLKRYAKVSTKPGAREPAKHKNRKALKIMHK